MSVETLRRAASLMRERAEASAVYAQVEGWWQPEGIRDVMLGFDDSIIGADEDAEHIASWHPAVALAVADWLDATAAENDSPPDSALGFLNFIGADALAALAAARAYLGEADA